MVKKEAELKVRCQKGIFISILSQIEAVKSSSKNRPNRKKTVISCEQLSRILK